jgi:phage tail sheath gpL-like
VESRLIPGTSYKYEVASGDDLTKVVKALIGLINAGNGDPNVFALADPNTGTIILTSKIGGTDANSITLATSLSNNAVITGLAQNQIGVYEVDLELNSGLNTDMLTQLTIAQDIFVSNIVTIPVGNPNAIAPNLVQAAKPPEEPKPAAETKKGR